MWTDYPLEAAQAGDDCVVHFAKKKAFKGSYLGKDFNLGQ